MGVPVRWLVDGMNVIGSRPDGWWRDRAGAARRLTQRLADFAAATGDEVTVVFEGGVFPGLAAGRAAGIEVLYAHRHGRNAADDRIVEVVGCDADPSSLAVVTSDRALVARIEGLGGSTVGPGTLLRKLDQVRP